MKDRIYNGYRAVTPEGAKTGWVYEHIQVAEKSLGRPLTSDEVVHHLDLDKLNNQVENLLVLERSQHRKIHAWIDRGCILHKNGEHNPTTRYCSVCKKLLQRDQMSTCSVECDQQARPRKAIRPEKDQLVKDVLELNWTGTGKKYGVSDNSVRKWAKSMGLVDTIRQLQSSK